MTFLYLGQKNRNKDLIICGRDITTAIHYNQVTWSDIINNSFNGSLTMLKTDIDMYLYTFSKRD